MIDGLVFESKMILEQKKKNKKVDQNSICWAVLTNVVFGEMLHKTLENIIQFSQNQ